MCAQNNNFLRGIRSSTLCLLSQIISCVLPIDHVFAQQSDQDTTVLPEVTVKASERANLSDDGLVAKRARTGTKTDTPLNETPQSVSVITREQLDMRSAQTVTEALRYTAGVTTQPYGADPRYDWLFIRGFSATTLSNYRDGLRQMTPACCFSVYRIDPFEMERIEVLKGPTSVLYGQNSPGGIVNRVSKRPTDDPVQEIKAEIGSFNRRQLDFDFGTASEDKNVSYRVVGVYRDSDTQYRETQDNRRSISPSVTWKISPDTRLTLHANYLEDENGSGFVVTYPGNASAPPKPTDVTYGEKSYNGFDHRQYSVGYEFKHRFNNGLAFRQNARYSDIKVDYRTLGFASLRADGHTFVRGASRVLENQNEFVIDNQLETAFDTGTLRHTLLFGVDYLGVDLDSQTMRGLSGTTIDVLNPVYGQAVTWPTTVTTKTKQEQAQAGFYLQDQIKLDQHWVATLGGRYDLAKTRAENRLTGVINDQNDHAFSSRVGLTYLHESGWAPYASYSESFLPTLGSDFNGNAFKPTRGKQYEIGVKRQRANARSTFTAALFNLTQQNALTADPANTNFSVQTGEIRSRGLELEAVADLMNGVNVIASFTYADVRNTRTNTASDLDKHPVLIPSVASSVWANYIIRGGNLAGLGFGGGVRYVGRSAIDTANRFYNASSTVYDAALFYVQKSWRYSLNVANLFDRKIVNCYGTSSCSFGAERTLNLSARSI